MSSPALAKILASDFGVSPSYGHKSKRVTPGSPMELSGLLLKWYAVHVPSEPVPDSVTHLAQRFLERTSLEARGLGFVVLHRCEQGFYFLMVCTWRGSNEIWQTVFYKDAGMTEFAIFPRDGQHKPNFCVWELAAVQHERLAWIRFLESARDLPAAERWLSDRAEGPA